MASVSRATQLALPLDGVIYIPLRSDKYPELFALVDEEDFALVSAYTWSPTKDVSTFYAKTKVRDDEGRWHTIKMHRLILGLDGPEITDHRDGNGLNNTRKNIRPATYAENANNRRLRVTNRSGYKGVTKAYRGKRWQVAITSKGVRYHIGYFPDPISGARAYDEKAREIHGEFARLNFPEEI